MFQFSKKLASTALRNVKLSFSYQPALYFCTQNKTLSPTYTKIKDAYFGKGKTSK